ncbi:MAG: hypothetical protein AAFY99_04905 [Pseudomonadota bacterium]
MKLNKCSMSTTPSLFDIETATLSVSGFSKEPTVIERLLGPRRVTVERSDQPVVEIRFCEPKEIAGSRTAQFEIPIIDGPNLLVFDRTPDRLVVGIDESLVLELHQNGLSKLFVEPDRLAFDDDVSDLIIFGLDNALAMTRQSLFHAACLVSPDQQSSILLHAPSGTGKTTTAFALVSIGYKIAGDDATAVRYEAKSERMLAWGIPRAPKVHQYTVNTLPFLAPFFDPTAADRNGEQFLDRQALVKADIFHEARSLPVSAVISLSRNGNSAASIERVEPLDALQDLLDDNISAFGGKLMPNDDLKLTNYSALAKCASGYRANLSEAPEPMANMIAETLGA